MQNLTLIQSCSLSGVEASVGAWLEFVSHSIENFN